jgi:hypothetical protein
MTKGAKEGRYNVVVEDVLDGLDGSIERSNLGDAVVDWEPPSPDDKWGGEWPTVRFGEPPGVDVDPSATPPPGLQTLFNLWWAVCRGEYIKFRTDN